MENAGMEKQPKTIIRKMDIPLTVIKRELEEKGLLWFIKLQKTKYDIKTTLHVIRCLRKMFAM